jgi:hypothetical protein
LAIIAGRSFEETTELLVSGAAQHKLLYVEGSQCKLMTEPNGESG